MVATGLVLVLAAPVAGAAGHTVNGTANGGLDPKNLSIKVNDTVTWHSADGLPHNATSPGFDTVLFNGAADGSHRFDQVGVFDYYCSIHGAQAMSGRITVEAPPPTTATTRRPPPTTATTRPAPATTAATTTTTQAATTTSASSSTTTSTSTTSTTVAGSSTTDDRGDEVAISDEDSGGGGGGSGRVVLGALVLGLGLVGIGLAVMRRRAYTEEGWDDDGDEGWDGSWDGDFDEES
jgi:plastocyanin